MNNQLFISHCNKIVIQTGDPGSWTIVCDGVQDLIYEFAMKEVRRLGAGGFMTEFGALDDLPNGIDNIVNLLSKFNS